MSAIPDVRAPSLSTSGFEDGLGRRSIRFDREVGGILECLHLRPELTGFEPVLRATSARIAALGDERFARTLGFERDAHGLVVLSELPSGERLSDILDTRRGEEAGISALDAAIGLLLQVMPALATLHGIGIGHGTLAPGRIIVTAEAQVVLVDSSYGAVVERLGLSRRTLWETFQILAAPSAGAVRLDARADIAQAALSAACLALGRPLTSTTSPDLHLLVGELTDVAQIRAGERFADAVRDFFQTALPRAAQTAVSAETLGADVARLAEFVGADTALSALSELVRSGPAVDSTFPVTDVEETSVPEAPPAASGGWWPFGKKSRAEAAPNPAAHETELEPADAVRRPPQAPEPEASTTREPDPQTPAVAPETVPAEFLPVSAPALVHPPTPKELAAPDPAPVVRVEPPAAPPPLVSPAVQETFEIAASVPPPAAPDPSTSWIPAVTAAPWTPPVQAPSLPPAPPASTSPWSVATSVAPTVFAPPATAPPPAPPTPVNPPSTFGLAPPAPMPPAPASPIGIAPPSALIAPPAATTAPSPVLQPPQKLKLKTDGPTGYTPTRANASTAHPIEPASHAHSVPFIDRLAAEQDRRRFPWKIVAAAVVVLVIGGFAGRDYLRGVTESAPPASEPAAPAAPAAAPTVGSLDVNSLPSGARVVLDGDEVGVTPLKLESVTPGRHTVVVSTDTASVRRTVRIEAGKTVSLDLSVFAGWVAVFSPITLHISEDGRALGTTESGRIMLPPGRHVLTLTNTEYGYSAKETVEIVAGEERALNITPKGTVNVNAQPWAEVWIDGQRIGETPIANLQVPLGTREFVFKHPQYGERKTITTVTSTPSAISMDFTRQY